MNQQDLNTLATIKNLLDNDFRFREAVKNHLSLGEVSDVEYREEKSTQTAQTIEIREGHVSTGDESKSDSVEETITKESD